MHILLVTSLDASVTLTLSCGISPDSLLTVFTASMGGALGPGGTPASSLGVTGTTVGTPASGLAGGGASTSVLGGGGATSGSGSLPREIAPPPGRLLGRSLLRSGVRSAARSVCRSVARSATRSGGWRTAPVPTAVGGFFLVWVSGAMNVYLPSVSAVKSCVQVRPEALVTISWCGPAGVSSSIGLDRSSC